MAVRNVSIHTTVMGTTVAMKRLFEVFVLSIIFFIALLLAAIVALSAREMWAAPSCVLILLVLLIGRGAAKHVSLVTAESGALVATFTFALLVSTFDWAAQIKPTQTFSAWLPEYFTERHNLLYAIAILALVTVGTWAGFKFMARSPNRALRR